MKKVKLYVGDALTRLKELPDNSIDSIVTDPPYEIGYNGKAWDSSGIAFSVELWAEALRVLKPGGHLISFGAGRTWHRMACAVEDAGFEIRDQIAWLYSSGMPKATDMSNLIDKLDTDLTEVYRCTAWMRSTGITSKEINTATGTNMASHYLTKASQPTVPVPELMDLLRPLFAAKGVTVPDWVEQLVKDRAPKNSSYYSREVIGEKIMGENPFASQDDTTEGRKKKTVKITKAKTPEAEKWVGWTTSLKPNFEPAVLARKPVKEKTVAANVVKYGTGAMNIAATRYDFETIEGGRYTSNVMIDESAATELGDPARFFYVAKPSPSERPVVNNQAHPTVKPLTLMRQLVKLVTPPGGVVLDIFAGSGSTLEAAALEGFDSIGFELTPEYVPLIEFRADRTGFILEVE
jgi:site-specific DNA-methyltransferase (adenine-specific)